MPWKKKHRERKSPRLKGWDYGQTAAYFITICTKNRHPFFGHIKDNIMGLSHMGVIANWFWHKIPDQFPHVELDEFIVIPNHVHGILIIYDHRDAINRDPVDEFSIDDVIIQPGGATGWHNPMLSEGDLGKVIRWYKGRCTFEIRQRKFHSFEWQGRYWDHIIRDDQSLTRIRDYIYNNPLNWKTDLYHETE